MGMGEKKNGSATHWVCWFRDSHCRGTVLEKLDFEAWLFVPVPTDRRLPHVLSMLSLRAVCVSKHTCVHLYVFFLFV